MSSSELKAVAVSMAEAFPDAEVAGMQAKIAKDFSVPRSTVSGWIGAIYNRRRWQRNAVIWKLSRLGWTNESIGKHIGLDESAVRLIIGESSEWEKLLQSLLDRMDPAEAARKQDLPELLVWAVALEQKPDLERMQALGFPVRPYDVWNFTESDDRFGSAGYPGQTPAALLANLLFYFTEPGDLVLDPMAGGGTCPDVALVLGRRCLAYDLVPTDGRADIIKADATELPGPPKGRKAKLVFWDPPYFSKKDYPLGGVSHMDSVSYMGALSKVAERCRSWLDPGGRLAFLMSDFVPSFDGKVGDTIWLWDYVEGFEELGYTAERRIQCPLSSQQLHPADQKNFPAQKKMGRLGRDLLVFRR